MRRPQGYMTISDPIFGVQEWDTFTCNHCNKIVRVMPYQDPTEVGGGCRQCNRLICGPCVDRLICIPFEKKLDIVEAAFRKSGKIIDTSEL